MKRNRIHTHTKCTEVRDSQQTEQRGHSAMLDDLVSKS